VNIAISTKLRVHKEGKEWEHKVRTDFKLSLITKWMKQSSWEANSQFANQEIARFSSTRRFIVVYTKPGTGFCIFIVAYAQVS
jgi:hypothetical protein